MLNRRKHYQIPTFLEGTPGLYVKRESPPRVPSTAPILLKSDVFLNTSNHITSKSLSNSRSSLFQTSTSRNLKKINQMGASTPALMTQTLYSSTASVATTPGNSGIHLQNLLSAQQRQVQNREGASRRLSHTPIKPHRRIGPRHELSSHSFNNLPSSSWTRNCTENNSTNSLAMTSNVKGEKKLKNISSNQQRQNLSNDASFKRQNNFIRQNLTTSLSFGNVTESSNASQMKFYGVDKTHNFTPLSNILNQPTKIVQQKPTVPSNLKNIKNNTSSSLSLQSLPGSSILQDQITSSSISTITGSNGIDTEVDLPLPPNWEIEVTPDGIRYYVDHDHRRTHWIHPLAVENLSPGWIKIFDQAYGVVYYNELDQKSQFEHPGLATPAAIQFNKNLTQQQFFIEYNQNFLSKNQKIAEECSINAGNYVNDLNIIDDKDVPEWIKLYSETSFESDYLLDFKMFDVLQLEKFDQMLMKLFKQDAINTVIKYERPRRELNNELTRRNITLL